MRKYQAGVTILAVFIFVCFVALSIAGADGDSESIPVGKFRLDVGEDIAILDDTMVVRMVLKINPSAHELGTRIQFRYLDKLSHDGWAGGLHRKLEHNLLFVAQFKDKSPSCDVPVLMYTFQHGGAGVSDLQEAPGKSGLDEVLRLTASSGFYDLETPLVIGELAGSPITLSVEPPPKR